MTYNYWDGARGLSVFYVHDQRTRSIERYIVAFLSLLFVFLLFSVATRVVGGVEKMNFPKPVQEFLASAPLVTSEETIKRPTDFNHTELANIVNSWSAKNKGSESVVVADLNGNVLASSSPDQTFFAASIYKLYVVYLAYQDVDAGLRRLDEPFLNGWTRGKCLDEAIRSSHSPCAEKLMSEMGKKNIQSRLEAYGLRTTKMSALTTSANDVTLVLGRLSQGNDLSAASSQAMLASMLGQQYRSGLAKGFSNSQVYDKVGFRDQSEYHDVAIVRLADGRQVIVTVMTSDVGVRSISQLASSLQKSFTN